MNFGKTLFAQLMEFVPWTSFAGVCGISEPRLLANQMKLYIMGFRAPVKRSTLADANEARNWHIWEDLAMLLIQRARKLYCNDSFGIDLTTTAYALDTTTIDLCLSLFSWALFRTNKAAVGLYTLLDLRDNIPSNWGASASQTRKPARRGVPDQQHDPACTEDCRTVQKPLAS